MNLARYPWLRGISDGCELEDQSEHQESVIPRSNKAMGEVIRTEEEQYIEL